jgi:hypothetical protein
VYKLQNSNKYEIDKEQNVSREKETEGSRPILYLKKTDRILLLLLLLRSALYQVYIFIVCDFPNSRRKIITVLIRFWNLKEEKYFICFRMGV